ncbi:hypothetical protein CEXT_720401 [Caerostris extrusa]|uniref:Uncharacterized protein n=1 Tax=Caerostris extrusa TaxID=172846 RepID=A0AAV4NCR4_CAEEX|nr:hypothetical protein CEXT_720401 [Caerostris extrusa]
MRGSGPRAISKTTANEPGVESQSKHSSVALMGYGITCMWGLVHRYGTSPFFTAQSRSRMDSSSRPHPALPVDMTFRRLMSRKRKWPSCSTHSKARLCPVSGTVTGADGPLSQEIHACADAFQLFTAIVDTWLLLLLIALDWIEMWPELPHRSASHLCRHLAPGHPGSVELRLMPRRGAGSDGPCLLRDGRHKCTT